MKFSSFKPKLPKFANLLLTFLAAILLTLSFPDFNLWFLAWIALVPLFVAIEREKMSIGAAAILGWIFGTVFFFSSCWWLTFSMITYGGLSTPVAYLLLFAIVAIVGMTSAVFGGLFSIVLKRFGSYGVFSAPFIWTAVEFGRYWLFFNNWNEIAYSQAFNPELIKSAQFGGIYLVGFLILLTNAFAAFIFLPTQKTKIWLRGVPVLAALIVIFTLFMTSGGSEASRTLSAKTPDTNVVAIQANVPMSDLDYEKWLDLRERHVRLAEEGIRMLSERQPDFRKKPLLIIFSESPMNFKYQDDLEFRDFIEQFATRHNAFVLFNSAEPNAVKGNYFNSAVLVDPRGEKIGQYDKIHLVPFGEYAPVPDAIAEYIPTLIGSFELGKEYDLFPIGDAQAGILICYESHFPTLSRRFVLNGADVLIEMTNDGYLGETGVLKQHLASAVFRAVETNRPVLRTTNVGITAYIDENGVISEASKSYTEDFRVWPINKSDGRQTFYVRYGDWFAWFSVLATLGFLTLRKRKANN